MLEEIRPIVLAAGKGTRMRSELPKALHRLAGRPLLSHVLEALHGAGFGRPIVVVGHGAELVEEVVGDQGDCVYQKEQRGTGDAVRTALDAFPDLARVLIVNGDLPLLRPRTLQDLAADAGSQGALLTAQLPDPHGFGRIARDAEGRFAGIIEEADCDDAQRAILEVNVGVYLLQAQVLAAALRQTGTRNAQGELYLVDAVVDLGRRGKILALPCDVEEAGQVNDRRDLASAEAVLRRRQVARLMDAGVTVLDPATTYVDATVSVGADTILRPFTFLEGETTIGEGCDIGPHTRIVDTRIGDGCHVEFSVVEETTLGDGTSCGPFTHLRPGTETGKQVSIGNFVEVKAVRIGDQTKVRHHTYLGNAEIGRRVNIGAGTVIVNYDGKRKHFTRIGDEAFVGCNSNLVSPVEIGPQSYVAAGSTITHDVPQGSLGVARERQRNIEGWVARRREREE
ncbi:MAG: bifunctional UDP-N-acetylglucosamine diphosphorylase/glucosamine-1-phosphate N-acetyltransferase GlmU [Thermaerobacter sp.]|nr:bifunctional UDP-N-acetylglucosamine diphosphorylase/glucosamine-1-phosphate N-acetyltransferase GlmU [Thermaerobacter sp.]